MLVLYKSLSTQIFFSQSLLLDFLFDSAIVDLDLLLCLSGLLGITKFIMNWSFL